MHIIMLTTTGTTLWTQFNNVQLTSVTYTEKNKSEK